jgi:hypothetical protein
MEEGNDYYQFIMEMEGVGLNSQYRQMPFNGFELQFYPDPLPVGGTKSLNLLGANVISTDATVVQLKLTEKQRIAAIRMSATNGGDGDPIVFDATPESVVDLAGNFAVAANNLTAVEIQDTTPPVILRGSIDFNTGEITVTATEILDTSGPDRYNTSKIVIANHSSLPCSFEKQPSLINTSPSPSSSSLGNVNATSEQKYTECVILSNSIVSPETKIDATLIMSEKERYEALRMSGVDGGDGTPLFLRLYPGAFSDVSRSPCAFAELFNATLKIVPDTTPPIIKNVVVQYSTGTVIVTFNETIDTRDNRNFNLSEIVLLNGDGKKVEMIDSFVKNSESVNLTFTLIESILQVLVM